jgi:hypothetical protein
MYSIIPAIIMIRPDFEGLTVVDAKNVRLVQIIYADRKGMRKAKWYWWLLIQVCTQ